MWELLLFLVVSRHFFINFTLKDSLSHLFYCASTSCPCTFCSCVFIDLLQYLRAKAVHLSMGMLLFANISLLKILSAHMWKHRVSHHTPKYTGHSWDSRCYPFVLCSIFYVLPTFYDLCFANTFFFDHFILQFWLICATTVVTITPENQHLLQSGYEARTPEELPVLQRWFENVETPSADYLDIILYSADQIVKENAAMGKERTQTEPWGIVSIKPQNSTQELPMQPITMLRNALGKEEGGSGVRLERSKYNDSVEFWKAHAPVRSKK